MARPRNLTPSEKLHISLPSDLALRLQIFLTNPATGRVPPGSYQKFFTTVVQEFFARGHAPKEGTPT